MQVSYRLPGDSVKRTASYTCPYIKTEFAELPACYRFATSVAMFSSILKESKYVKKTNWNDVLRIAVASVNPNDPAQKNSSPSLKSAQGIWAQPKEKKQLAKHLAHPVEKAFLRFSQGEV